MEVKGYANGIVACAEPKWVEPEVVKCAMSVCDLWTLLATIDVGNVGEWRSGSIHDEDALAIFLPSLIGIQKKWLKGFVLEEVGVSISYGVPPPPPPPFLY